jgi:hypothetical protein
MARYLVIAHQTAESYELAEALQKRQEADPDAQFTLLVPITYAGFLVLPEQGDDQRVVARARRVGEAAAYSLNEAGVNVNRVIVGDEIPVIAMEEELIDRPADYAEIIFCTLPESISRWMRLDQLRQAEERYGLPVHHVIAVPQIRDDVDIN